MFVPYLIMNFFIGIIFQSIALNYDYPIHDFSHYWKAYGRLNSSFEPGNLLPRKQSEHMKFNRLYYTEDIDINFILEVETDGETIQEYKKRLEEAKIDIDENTSLLLGEAGMDGSYKVDTYKIYYLEARCTGNGYCNHGRDIHIAIREISNEMTFYYSVW